jgi:8-oxo-dGTP diphosphatase
MLPIHVAAAVIIGEDGKILIARRPDHVHKGGLWEFPGGKVEEGEGVRVALARELEEELAIGVIGAEPLLNIHHVYTEKTVLLDVWMVTKFSGDPRGNEGQDIAWVAVDQLGEYQFPEANQPIIDLLKSQANH